MPTVQELRDKRAAAWANAQEYNQRTEMSAEDETAWARALDEVDELAIKIKNRERNEALEERFEAIDDEAAERVGQHARAASGASDGTGTPPDPDADYREAFDEYLRRGLDEVTPEQRQLLRARFRAGADSRAQGVGVGSAGGYTVPESFWAKVTETMLHFGGVLQAGVETIDTDTGVDIPWPTNDDTGNEGIELAENVASGDQDLSFGGKTLGAIMYTSKQVKASFQLLQDSGIDVEGFIARKLGERLGRIFNRRWTTGTGAGQPQGFVTGLTVGKTTASATAITVNEVIDLVHSVDAAYRGGPNIAFQLNDLVLAYVRKIKDDSGGAGLGRPIWEPSIQAGQPDTLFGYRTVVNNHMASTVATGNKTMAFGDWRSAYVARRVNGAQMLRLNERYAEALQVGFLAFQRIDGLVQDPSAAKVLQQA